MATPFERIVKKFSGVQQMLNQAGLEKRELRSAYAELLVARKLERFGPQVWNERKNKNADIYLEHLDKRVEVKSTSLKEGTFWDWAFQFSQIRKHKFDYCVLVAFRNQWQVLHTFVMTSKDLGHLKLKRRNSLAGTNTYIEYFKDKREYLSSLKRGTIEKVETEYLLNTRPSLFENRWEDIR